jgi:hypothetical protein
MSKQLNEVTSGTRTILELLCWMNERYSSMGLFPLARDLKLGDISCEL